MKTLILYKTKWGSTREYAQWLQNDLGGVTVKDIDEIDVNLLKDFDLIVIGSRTYMGKVQAVDFMTKNWEILKTKQLYLFTVGVVPLESKEGKASFEAIPAYIREHIVGHRKLPGVIDISKLNFFEKVILKTKKAEIQKIIEHEDLQPVVNDVKAIIEK